MMTAERANAIMQGAPATEEEKREAQQFLNASKSNGSNYEGGTATENKKQSLGDKLFMSPEELHEMTKDRADVKARGDMAMRANPAVDAIDILQNDATGLKGSDNAVQLSDTKGGELTNEGKFQLGSKVDLEDATGVKPGETATINKNDSTEDKNAKKRYNQSTMSIWDAYNNGLIDKETAGYFTVDALATLAKNLGRGIGNVGAQFSGGSIDQGHDASMWEQRKDEIFNQELQGEAEGIQNYANTMKKYNLTKASTINELLNTVKADVDKLDDDNPAKIAYLALAAQMANGQIDGNTTLAGVGAKAAAPLLEKIEGWLGGKK